MTTTTKLLGVAVICSSLGGLAGLGGLGGCATADPKTAYSSSFVRTRSYHVQQKRHGDAVQLFALGKPSRRFIEVGVLTVRDWNYPRVVWFAKDLAARAGCDAIVQMESGKVVHRAYTNPYGGSADYHTVARFSCILWPASGVND